MVKNLTPSPAHHPKASAARHSRRHDFTLPLLTGSYRWRVSAVESADLVHADHCVRSSSIVRLNTALHNGSNHMSATYRHEFQTQQAGLTELDAAARGPNSKNRRIGDSAIPHHD